MRSGSSITQDRGTSNEQPRAIPLLKFGTNGNFGDVKELLFNKLTQEYSFRAKFINDYKYHIPKPPSLDTMGEGYETASEEVKNDALKVITTEYAKENSRWMIAKPKVFATIVSILSPAARAHLETDVDWIPTYENQDPLTLWNLIKNNQLLETQNISKETVRYELRNKYGIMKMKSEESLLDFRHRFDLIVSNMTSAGCDTIPNKESQALDFIFRLDDVRYEDFKRTLNNGVIQKTIKWPTTIEQAYVLARSHIPPRANNSSVSSPTRTNAFIASSDKADRKPGPDHPCHECGGTDHWRPDCPNPKATNTSRDERKRGPRSRKSVVKNKAAVATMEKHEEEEDDYDNYDKTHYSYASFSNIDIDRYDLIFDTGASISVIKNMDLLVDLYHTANTVYVNGISSKLASRISGTIPSVGSAIYMPESNVNILAANTVEGKFNITYNAGVFIKVHINDEIILTFNKENGLYICKFEQFIENLKSIHNNSTSTLVAAAVSVYGYTNAEVKKAHLVRSIMKKLGFTSAGELARMITTGAIINSPITLSDIAITNKIFGPDASALKGKMTNAGPVSIKSNEVIHMVRTNQSVHADIMYVDEEKFLLSVVKPINMLVVSHITHRNAKLLHKTLTGQLDHLSEKGFKVDKVFVDAELSMTALRGTIPNVEINVAGTGSHEQFAERAIRLVKERVRCIMAGLMYHVPKVLLKWVVTFCVNRINCTPRSSGINISPREAFTGRKLDYKRDLTLCFGDYVQLYREPKRNNDVNIPRSTGAIALCPKDNVQGSWFFFNLNTNNIVSGDNYKVMDLTTEVVEKMNSIYRARDTILSDGTDIIPTIEEHAVHPYTNTNDDNTIINDHVNDNEPDNTADNNTINDINNADDVIAPVEVANENANDVTLDNSGGDSNIEDTFTDTTNADSNNSSFSTPTTTPIAIANHTPMGRIVVNGVTRSNRIIARTNHTVLHVSLYKGINTYKDLAINAMKKELKQLVDKKVWSVIPIKEKKHIDYKKIIRSSLFFKEKLDNNGDLTRLKARLVAGGDQQDKSLYSNINSPTVRTDSIFTCLAIAAAERRHIASIDIEGAYLEAVLPANEVYMYLHKDIADTYTDMLPECKQHVDHKNRILVMLNKALYGCVQSAKLWYTKLVDVLVKIGFKQNPSDKCVFNMYKNSIQITVLFHVDDLLFTCVDIKLLDSTIITISEEFTAITQQPYDDITFLGMEIIRKASGDIKVSMSKYSNEIVIASGVEGISTSPASPELFKDESDMLLTDADKKSFHTAVAKLLYLAKKLRPDILTAVSHLASRVNMPNHQDREKVNRVYRYIRGTSEYYICYTGGGNTNVNTYVDASFLTHKDAKSRTGIIIMINNAPVYASSSKQKMVSLSSTEAELIGLSGAARLAVATYEFLKHQGVNVINNIHEDNLSTISLVETGNTSNRTKHINMKYFYVHELLKHGKVNLLHCASKDMIADLLTKPLSGSKYTHLREKFLHKNTY